MPVEIRRVHWISWDWSCKPPCGGWEPNLGPLEEQQCTYLPSAHHPPAPHLPPCMCVRTSTSFYRWEGKCNEKRWLSLGSTLSLALSRVAIAVYHSYLHFSLRFLTVCLTLIPPPPLVISGALRRRRTAWWAYSCT